MAIDEMPNEETALTWEEMMRLRGYDDEYIERARERRARRFDDCM